MSRMVLSRLPRILRVCKLTRFSTRCLAVRSVRVTKLGLNISKRVPQSLYTPSIWRRFCATTKSLDEAASESEQLWTQGNLADAIALMEKAISAAQQPSAVILEKLGDMYLNTNAYDKAIDAYTRSLASQEDPNILVKRGEAKHRQGDRAAARTDYLKALEHNSAAQLIAWRRLGYSYLEEIESVPDQHKIEAEYRENMLTKAVDAFTNALLISRTDVQSLYGRGSAYRLLKKYTDARSDLEYAVRLDNEYAPAYFKLGRLSEETRMWPEGVYYYEKFLNIFVQYYSSLGKDAKSLDGQRIWQEVMFRRGWCYLLMKDYYAARDDFIAAGTVTGPFQASAYWAQARAYMEEAEWNKALDLVTKALQIDPKLVFAYRDRAMIYYCLGNEARAEEDIHMMELLKREAAFQGEAHKVLKGT